MIISQEKTEKYIKNCCWNKTVNGSIGLAIVGTLSIGASVGGIFAEAGTKGIIGLLIVGIISFLFILLLIFLNRINSNLMLMTYCDPIAYARVARRPDKPYNKLKNSIIDMQTAFYRGDFTRCVKLCDELISMKKCGEKLRYAAKHFKVQALFFNGRINDAAALVKEFSLTAPSAEFIMHFAGGEYEAARSALYSSCRMNQMIDAAKASANRKKHHASKGVTDIQEVVRSYMLLMVSRMLKDDKEAQRYEEHIKALDNKTYFSEMCG